jgi:hypothetical protein
MIGFSSVVTSSPPVPALNSAPPRSFNTLFDSAANTVHADSGPELAKNPARVSRPDPSSHIKNDVSPEPPIKTLAAAKPGSPAEPIETEKTFRDHCRFESAEAKPGLQPENLQATPPVTVTEKPIDQTSPQALPFVALPLQQSLERDDF